LFLNVLSQTSRLSEGQSQTKTERSELLRIA
jgi:hypothetical protein